MRIGIDLDGVCYDFADSVCRYSASLGLTGHVLPDPMAWSFFESWGMDYAEFAAHCAEGVDAGVIFAGAPFDGAAEALRELAAAGHQLHVKTARSYGTPGRAEATTEAWLLEYGIRHASLTFTDDKTTGPECDLFIEDNVGNYDALDAVGVNVWLVDRPWNQDEPHGPVRRRLASLQEFADMVLALYSPQAGDVVFACIACSRRVSADHVETYDICSHASEEPIFRVAYGHCVNCRGRSTMRPVA